MLVVMMVLLVATASAAVSVHSTQSELRAAGHHRQAIQTRYVSEAAMMTTISWIDQLGQSGDWQTIMDEWKAPNPPPQMWHFAEPKYCILNNACTPTEEAGRHHAMSVWQDQQEALSTLITPPLSAPPPRRRRRRRWCRRCRWYGSGRLVWLLRSPPGLPAGTLRGAHLRLREGALPGAGGGGGGPEPMPLFMHGDRTRPQQPARRGL
jgi:hypothetical protein